MWIAKPLRALDASEQRAWCAVQARARATEGEAPLAQSLAWGRAIEAVSGKVFAVFSPEEQVGGLAFTGSGAQSVECVNGPYLDWDDDAKAPRQLATFASALARLAPGFRSLCLRPRWRRSQLESRLGRLPIPAAGVSHASTLWLPLGDDPSPRFSPRLRRCLRQSENAGAETLWEPLEPGRLVEFALAEQGFGRARGFAVPPILWFRALTEPGTEGEQPVFHLATSRLPGSRAGCRLLIAAYGGQAHYLFGHEWREGGTRAALSPSALAHRLAIAQAREAGLSHYDFNGYVEAPAPGDPYAGVSAFKKQFGAEPVHYAVPELRIEAG